MVTRIGDAAHSARINGFLQTTQDRIRDTQTSISTGKAAQSFSEIPDQAALLVSTREALAVEEVFAEQNSTHLDRLNAMEGALGGVTDMLERMRVLLSQRLSGPTGGEVPIDQEADNAIAELAAALNLQLDGRQLFSGTRSDTVSITLPATINNAADVAGIYGGDTTPITLRIDRNIDVQIDVTGADFQSAFDLLADLKEAHLLNDEATLRAGVDSLRTVLGDIADQRGALGSKAARIEAVQATQRASVDYLQETVSRIEDTDLPLAVSKLAQDEATLQASYLTVSRVNQLSLADFLR